MVLGRESKSNAGNGKIDTVVAIGRWNWHFLETVFTFCSRKQAMVRYLVYASGHA